MIIGTLTALLLTGCTAREQAEQHNERTSLAPSTQQQPAFLFVEKEYDFGILKQSGGKVSHDFAFTYAGDAPIVITALPTSCACASAEVDRRELESGDSGVLTVTFNPNLHEEPEGRFYKSVTMLTKPPLPSQPEVKIWAEIDLDLGPEAFELKDEHAHTSDEPENHQ